jgi:multimeric flavodoxin WrbA
MKKIFIINGSPRKNFNTAKMCQSFSNGAKSLGVETEIIHLYDIDFKGCRSCFACKLKDGKNFSRCAYPDELPSILDKIVQSDGLVLASPIYSSDVTGVMRCFIERLCFPFFQYEDGYPSTAPKKLKTAIICTMNVNEELCNNMYSDLFNRLDFIIGQAFTKPVHLNACDTYQFPNYTKYAAGCFNIEHKIKQRDEQLPKDMQKAFELGVNMARQIMEDK